MFKVLAVIKDISSQSMMSSKCTSPFLESLFLSIFRAHAVHSMFIKT